MLSHYSCYQFHVINWGTAKLVATMLNFDLLNANHCKPVSNLFKTHEPHIIFVKYEMYLCLFIFHYLDKNPGWVIDYGGYGEFSEDY
jgi:hypothetical protein